MSDINVTVQDEIVNIDVIDTPVLVEVTNSPGPAGAGVAAGGTTGQVLAKASNTNYDTVWVNPSTGGVPYSGATGNVNLGEYELKAGQVTLDTSPTGTVAVGTIRWNDTTGTSETTLKGGNVIIKNGVDLVARVVNKVSPNTTLTKAAYQAVRVSGAQGQRLAIELAQANNDAGSADTIGIVTETIAPNQEGFIMTVGQLEGINTTGSLQGETWVDGDVLYLSPTTAGAVTNVKPTAVTGHIVVIGYVEYAHQNNGKIYVKVMNGWELDELHNVSIVTPTNNQGLFYNSTSTLWENKSITTALGYTPVPTTRNITINGVTYDLSADRTYTISTGISGSGAAGQVTYWTGASAVSGSNNLTFSPTPSAASGLGVSLNLSPTLTATANNDVLTAIDLQPSFTNGAFTGVTNYAIRATGQVLIRRVGGNPTEGFSMQYVLDNTLGGTYASKFFSLAPGVAYRDLFFVSRATLFQIEGFRNTLLISNNGNVVVNSLTDASTAHKLQVYGDTLLRGSGNTSATTALSVQNSDSTTLFSIDNGGTLMNLPAAMTIRPFSSAGVLSFAGSGNRRYDFGSSETNTSTTAVTQTFITISRGFNPTSGTSLHTSLLISPLINQTGGANGITRGLYVNPTLTAAADFRAIETTAGNVLFGSNFFWDNTNGRLGIGTNAPNGIWSGNNRALQILSPSNFSAELVLSRPAGTFSAASVTHFLSGGGVDLFGVYSGSTTSSYVIYTNNNERLRIWTNGNALFGGGNNPSDLGVRLGVVGDTLLRGSGATSATTALTVQNSSSTNLFTVRNDGVVTVSGDILSGSTNIRVGFSNNSRTITFGDGNSGLTYQAFGGHRFTAFNGSVYSEILTIVGNQTNLRVGINQTSPNASSLLDLTSTDKGFLPPRMTTTQKNAIATPAAGLVVYDTTLNKLCVYTTAWETITSI